MSVILVTGAAGSIGGALTRRLLADGHTVRAFDQNEEGLARMAREYPNLRCLIGSVRDPERLELAAEGVDAIYHCAALKHVPLCEYNPAEALATNATGTRNVVNAAIVNNVPLMVHISTDKAVNPVSTMGVTKALAEKIVVETAEWRPKQRFVVVRLGNVLGSSGSIYPIIREQAEKGGPVTLTDPAMTRFMISPADAVGFILYAAVGGDSGDIWIPPMPHVLISNLIDALAPYANVIVTGKRPGEKVYEELWTDDECDRLYTPEGATVVQPRWRIIEGIARTVAQGRTSDDTATALVGKELEAFLVRCDLKIPFEE